MNRTINLRGPDGNAYVILGRTTTLLRQEGWAEEDIEEVMREATCSDYEHLLAVCQQAAGLRYVGRPKR